MVERQHDPQREWAEHRTACSRRNFRSSLVSNVSSFPKNKQAQCPMDGTPSIIDEKSLKELHIRVDVKKGD